MFDLCRDTGAALLLITHDPALTTRCHRALRMEDGRLHPDATAPASP